MTEDLTVKGVSIMKGLRSVTMSWFLRHDFFYSSVRAATVEWKFWLKSLQVSWYGLVDPPSSLGEASGERLV